MSFFAPQNPGIGGLDELTTSEETWIQTAVAGVVELTETTAPTNESGLGKLYVKSSDSELYFMDDGGGETQLSGGGAGVTGPGSSTDNAVTRFNGTSGGTLQNSGVILDDSNNITGVGNLTLASDIIHTGDTNNLIRFGTDTQDFQTGGSSRLDISDSGVRLGGANARVTTVLDEDNMASDSATALATQQSIKAYVDGAASGITEIVQDTTPQLGGNLDTNSFNIEFDDAHGIFDDSSNEQLLFQKTTSAVNYFEMTNAATANAPLLAVVGDDANVDFELQTKGTGTYNFLATASGPTTIQIYEDTDNGTNYIALQAPSAITSSSTITIPEADDTLVARATTDTLTNKTIDADNNTITNIALGAEATGAMNDLSDTSLADPGADQLVFWDDSDSQFEFISTLTGLSITANTLAVDTADLTTSGIVELATAAETTTGTDATRAVTPDGLAGSDFGIRYMQFIVFDFTTDTATGDGKFYAHVPAALDGMNLVEVHAEVITAGTTGTTDIQIHNLTQAADMLSTKLTIDSAETGSDTAATAAVIDTANDDIAENDVLRVDVDAVSTTAAKGLIVTLGFQLP